jgi:hypothetical protein
MGCDAMRWDGMGWEAVTGWDETRRRAMRGMSWDGRPRDGTYEDEVHEHVDDDHGDAVSEGIG